METLNEVTIKYLIQEILIFQSNLDNPQYYTFFLCQPADISREVPVKFIRKTNTK